MAVVVASGVGFLALGWQMQNAWGFVVGAIVLTVGVGALRRIAKADPQMFSVYPRYLRYQGFYSARGDVRRRKPHRSAVIYTVAGLAVLFLLLGLLTASTAQIWAAVALLAGLFLFLLWPSVP